MYDKSLLSDIKYTTRRDDVTQVHILYNTRSVADRQTVLSYHV